MPDIGDILRSQRPPPTFEATRSARSLLEQEEVEIRRYDEELRHLRGVLDKLEHERKLLYRQVEQRRSWLAPIRRVPTEILEYILYLVQANSPSLRIDDETLETPLYDVSRVCSYWRHIVLAQPTWWKRLSLDICGMTRYEMHLVEHYLRRSQGHSLSIHLSDSQPWKWVINPSGKHIGTYGLKAFAILMRRAGRIRELTFNVPWDIFPCLFSHRMEPRHNTAFSSLESFSCVGEIPGNIPWFSHAIKASAPKLNAATLGGISLNPVSSRYGLPFSKLRSLTIQVTLVWGLIEHILPECTQLTHLTMQSVLHWEKPVLPQMVELPKLQHLSLTYAQPADYNLFFEMVRLPALRSVAIAPAERGFDPKVPVEWPSEAFLGMLRRESVELQALTIYFPDSALSSVDPLVDLLMICRGLSKLSFHMKDSTKTLMDISQRLIDSGHRWPTGMSMTLPPSDPVQGVEQLVGLLSESTMGLTVVRRHEAIPGL
ncbi:hypothetical protein VNI00_000615 [Paramarasmius palmivorus]|uniref:F-box domain-containing protein n=1 Tax=Paramarasmius palmivorus TaxID=297713 RepID=A0AAW0E9N0_9AGAR